MQLIVLGMHRSGTSAVSRLLNMMGAYFSPPDQVLPPTEANPKGFWERKDVLRLHERMLEQLEMSWDDIGAFREDALTPKVTQIFEQEARAILYGLDAHRPWFLKDPRMCLLLPFWRPLLEIPVCVYVYRTPLQVAHSLQKVRSDFSLNFGVALWEKYNAHALDNSRDMPRIFIAHEALMENPLATVEKLYHDLQALEVQGLRMPTQREIEAFIDPALYRQRSAEEQGEFINQRQLALHQAFVNNAIDPNTHYIDQISTGAREHLAAYHEKQTVTRENLERIALLESEVAEKSQLVERYEEDTNRMRARMLDLQSAIDDKEKEIRRLSEENHRLDTGKIASEKEKFAIKTTLIAREEALQAKSALAEQFENRIQLQDKTTHRLLAWLAAVEVDTRAIFQSATWKMGDGLTKMILRLLFRQPGRTAQDHLIDLFKEIDGWKSQHAKTFLAVQRGRIMADHQPTATHNPPRWDPGPSASEVNAAMEAEAAGGPPMFQPPAAEEKPAETPATPTFNTRDYAKWVKNYDTLSDKIVNKMQAQIKEWYQPPLISIILPTYNTPEKYLKEALDSVLAQIYPHWELCIADDASPESHVRKVLERYAAKDKRIKVVFREQNGHISAASNSALELAQGELVTFLDHDDRLNRHALFWVVKDYFDYPHAKLWYSDEDKITEEGERYEPYFKSDWNPDLFLSHNLVTHLAVYRADLVRELGGLREGYEGAQDYDLVLRVVEKIHAAEIRHIPRILYHWRAIAGSTASRGDEKPYALIAAKKAISEFLSRKEVPAVVTESAEVMGAIRVQYKLPAEPPLVSLIIPTRNGKNLLHTCVESIVEKTEYENYEILIVDNQSDDPDTLAYFEQLEQREVARIIPYPHPFNYADMNNQAVEHARGEIIGLLNNDLEVINRGWLTEMVSHAARSEIGAVGARLWYPDHTLQHGGVVLGIGGVAGHSHKGWLKGDVGYFGRAAVIQNFTAVTAACLLVRKELFLRVHGLDGENLKIAFNDVDFCLRLHELGYRNLWTPNAELFHHESASRGYEDTPEKAKRFERERQYMKRRWTNFLLMDPAYSPNLTLETQDFAFSWPPRVNQEP